MKSKLTNLNFDSLKPYSGNKKNRKLFFDQETERVYFDRSTMDTKDAFSKEILIYKTSHVKGYRLGELLVSFLNLSIDDLYEDYFEIIKSMINDVFSSDSYESYLKKINNKKMRNTHPYIETNDTINRTLDYIHSALAKFRESKDPSFRVEKIYRGMSKNDIFLEVLKEFGVDKVDDKNDHQKNYLKVIEELKEEIGVIKKVQDKYKKAISICFNGKATKENKSQILSLLYLLSKSDRSFINNKVIQETDLMIVHKNAVISIPSPSERHMEKFYHNIKKREYKAIDSINYTLDDACYYELLLIAKYKRPYISVCQYSKCNNYFFPSTSKNIYCDRRFRKKPGKYSTCKELGATETRRNNPYNRIFDDKKSYLNRLTPYEHEYKEFSEQAKEIKNAAQKTEWSLIDYEKQLNELLDKYK